MDLSDDSHRGNRVACFFHLVFKAVALLTYLFCSWFTDNFVLVFVFCVILSAVDFWTVKNVTGRLLVGLRWWNEVKEDGENVWIFESQPDGFRANPTNKLVFWAGLYAHPLTWILLAIVALVKFQLEWLLVVAVSLVLASANVVGYRRCEKDAHASAKHKFAAFIVNQL